MNLSDVKPVVEKYMNKAFRLYQDSNELACVFSERCGVGFQWDEGENITSATIETNYEIYTGETEEYFQMALNLLEVNSQILVYK